MLMDGQGKRTYLFMSLGRLSSNLQSSIITFKCEGGCSYITTNSQPNVDGPDIKKEISLWRDTRRYPVVLFDQADTGSAPTGEHACFSSRGGW